MKFIATLFFCCLAFSRVKAQTPCGDSSNNWNLEKGNTFVQIVFTDSLNTDSQTLANNILSQIKTTSGVKNIQILAGSIIFDIEGRLVDYKAQGYKWGTIPNSVLLHPMNYSVSIEIKKGKYRITCSKMVTYIPLSNSKMAYDWGIDIYNKEGCIRSLNKRSIMESLPIIMQDFVNTFELKRKVQKSDW